MPRGPPSSYLLASSIRASEEEEKGEGGTRASRPPPSPVSSLGCFEEEDEEEGSTRASRDPPFAPVARTSMMLVVPLVLRVRSGKELDVVEFKILGSLDPVAWILGSPE